MIMLLVHVSFACLKMINKIFCPAGWICNKRAEGGTGGKAGGEGEEEGRGGEVAISFGELRVLNFMLIMFTT